MESQPPHSSAPPTITSASPPPPTDVDRQHLTLLAVFYYVWAGLQLVLGGGFGLIYLGFGIYMLNSPEQFQGPNDPANAGTIAGGIVAAVGGFIVLLSLIFSILQVMAANGLRKARRRMFCMIIAGITCLSVPFGTILGVFTFVVLSRDSVARLFAGQQSSSGAGAATYR